MAMPINTPSVKQDMANNVMIFAYLDVPGIFGRNPANRSLLKVLRQTESTKYF